MVGLSAGKYELTREKVEFSQYMREEGYHIIPIKPEHQLVSPVLEQAICPVSCCDCCLEKPVSASSASCMSTPATTCLFLDVEVEVINTGIWRSLQLYGCNVLNLGNSRIISVNADTGRQIVKDPHFHGDVQVIDYSPITSMYGAVHCSSQVVRRLPSSLKDKMVQDALRKSRQPE